MADANTPRLNLVQPEVGASGSTWGFKWNNNATILDNALTIAGGEITGGLTVDGLLIVHAGIVSNAVMQVGGWGIGYTGVGPGHSIAFGWDGAEIQGFVDGSYIGNLATQQWTEGWVGSLGYASAAWVQANFFPLSGGALSGALSAPTISAGGRLFSYSNNPNSPSITLWNIPGNAAMGCWFDASPSPQLNWGEMDGAGNPVLGSMFTRPDGTFEITGQGWKPGGGMWAAPSDRRLKKDIVDYTSGLAEICALRPVSYRYNGLAGSKNDGRVHHGLIAQEVETVMPELVGTRRARLNPDDQSYADILTLDPTPAFFALINAVRELAGRVRALENNANK